MNYFRTLRGDIHERINARGLAQADRQWCWQDRKISRNAPVYLFNNERKPENLRYITHPSK